MKKDNTSETNNSDTFMASEKLDLELRSGNDSVSIAQHALFGKRPVSESDAQWRKRVVQACYVLPVVKGICYPIFKVALIALAEKLLRAIIREVSDAAFLERIEETFFEQSASPTMDVFLMRSLGFYGAFAVTAALVLLLSIVFPLYKALQENYLNHLEVKRLQHILYKRFILTPNSVAIDEASDLLYTKINAVEKYWSRNKYAKVGDTTTLVTGLVLMLLLLTWDLGLACLGLAAMVFGLSSCLWSKLSTPWAQQREEKVALANSHLIDVVVCKEVVLTHAQELQEETRLNMLLQDDQMDIEKLAWATFISEAVKTATFTMITPTLFCYVYTFDLTMDRVFQLLILIVVLDELMRSFMELSGHAAYEAEYARAKAGFCHVLGIEDILFPPDFNWSLKSDITETNKVELGPMDEELGLAGDTSTNRKSPRQVLRESMKDRSAMISQAFEEPTSAGELKLQKVSFGYKTKDGKESIVVDKLDMNLKVGHHYAIMGETGVGKSTLLKALSGLHEPLNGDIFFDGNAVDTTSVHWREQVAVVSQDSVFLNRSLRENLCYGLETSKSDEDVLAALDKVKMKEHILALPQGINTIMEGNGSTFSGGQQQRLQIARLLLSSCPLVLLDECTSALDPTTTEEILEVLRDFLVDKTMIMITHDAKTLVLAQHVLDMKADGIFERA